MLMHEKTCVIPIFVPKVYLWLGKDKPHGSRVCDVFLYFCHFPIRCPGSGMVLDCIDS